MVGIVHLVLKECNTNISRNLKKVTNLTQISQTSGWVTQTLESSAVVDPRKCRIVVGDAINRACSI